MIIRELLEIGFVYECDCGFYVNHEKCAWVHFTDDGVSIGANVIDGDDMYEISFVVNHDEIDIDTIKLFLDKPFVFA